MADRHLEAFDHGVDQLLKAHASDDEVYGLGAAVGLARLLFVQLDRIADAIEKLVDKDQ